MTKKDRQLFEQIKKMSVCVNVAEKRFEKIQMLETLRECLKNPNDKKEVDAEIAKLRANPEFKEYEVKKKLEQIKEDF